MLKTTLLLGGLAAISGHDGTDDVTLPSFTKPVRVMAAGAFVRVEAPGYAAPAWHDVDGDGRADLVVGQFKDGKMRVYRGLEEGFAAGEWLQAGGAIAEVPGVW